jgi:hypothetical protein
MKIAYLLPVHANPLHLARLVDRLAFGENRCFVHIDAKSDARQFTALQTRPLEILPTRIAVHWADFSIVEATLALLAAAMAHPARFDYFTLLSGVDYPVQSSLYIQNFFSAHAGTEFIDMIKMPAPKYGKPISRLTDYHYRPGEARIPQAPRDYRPVFGTFAPYAGSAWWSLTRETVGEILRFQETHPRIVEFYKNTSCPDESFFQTIIGTLAAAKPMRRSLSYADWRTTGYSPLEISEKHLAFLGRQNVFVTDEFGKAEILFARKFSDQRPDITDRLDALISRKNDTVYQRRRPLLYLRHLFGLT